MPGAIVQFNALATGTVGGDPNIKLASLLLSVGSVIVVVTTLDARKDSDATAKLLFGHFYGVIPNSGRKRTLVLSALKMMAMCQFAMTLLKMVLMAAAGG